jgi:hypothetical protein
MGDGSRFIRSWKYETGGPKIINGDASIITIERGYYGVARDDETTPDGFVEWFNENMGSGCKIMPLRLGEERVFLFHIIEHSDATMFKLQWGGI